MLTADTGHCIAMQNILLKLVQALNNMMKESLHDAQQQGKVLHSIRDPVQQRVFSMACGHEDCSDSTGLAERDHGTSWSTAHTQYLMVTQAAAACPHRLH